MFRNVDGIVLVFDITNRSSFDHIDNWIKDISNFTDKTTPIIICGNKSDSQYKVNNNYLKSPFQKVMERS